MSHSSRMCDIHQDYFLFYLHRIPWAALIGSRWSQRRHVNQPRRWVLWEWASWLLMGLMLRRLRLRVRRRGAEPFRLNLQGTEQRSDALLQKCILSLEFNVCGSEGSKHVRVFRIDIPDWGGDVFPQSGTKEGIVSRARAAIK